MIESKEDGDQNKVVLCDLMPIPLLDSCGEALVSQLQCNSKDTSVKFGFDSNSVSSLLINRYIHEQCVYMYIYIYMYLCI
jgi:hypothetical protein